MTEHQCPPCNGHCDQGRNCPTRPVDGPDLLMVFALELWPIVLIGLVWAAVWVWGAW